MNQKQTFSLKAKHKRLISIIALLACLFAGAYILTKTFKDNLIYYYSPSDINRLEANEQGRFNNLLTRKIRVGGLVKEGTIVKSDKLNTEFVLTDETFDIKVTYKGILPPLFRELQGIVAEGTLTAENGGNRFTAESLLTKHDENYMPPEVAESLKTKIHNANEK